jgi:hypothetical protein
MDEQIKKQIDFFWRYEVIATTKNTPEHISDREGELRLWINRVIIGSRYGVFYFHRCCFGRKSC